MGGGATKEPSVSSVKKRVEETIPLTKPGIKAHDGAEESLIAHTGGKTDLIVKLAEGKGLSNQTQSMEDEEGGGVVTDYRIHVTKLNDPKAISTVQ